MDVMIVDDERVARQTVRECCEAEPDLAVVGEYANADTALAAIRRRAPHLLFLDVQLGATSGIDLARALAPPALPLIVFVTAYDHYAREAFEVSAVDYLVKPFDEQRFRAMLVRVRQRCTAQSLSERETILATLIAQLERAARTVQEARPRLLAEAGGHHHMIDVAQIEALESDRNYVTLRVDVQIDDDSVILRVVNTVAKACTAGPAAIGLNNVRERLDVQFGADASFTAGPTGSEEWTAEITIPALRELPARPSVVNLSG